MIKNRIVLFVLAILNLTNLLADEGISYTYKFGFPDTINPGFHFQLIDNNLVLDIPETEQDRIEEGILIRTTNKFKFKKVTEGKFSYLDTENVRFLILNSENNLIKVIVNTKDNSSYWGIATTSPFVKIGSNIRRNWIGILNESMDVVNVSSALSEKIGKNVQLYNGKGPTAFGLNPWVESVPGNGIGEWIEKETTFNIDKILIINGFVRPNRPDLFNKNNRIKKLKVLSEGKQWGFDLKDLPDPQILNLPEKITGKIRLEIVETYNGTQYQDTALSAFYFLFQAP